MDQNPGPFLTIHYLFLTCQSGILVNQICVSDIKLFEFLIKTNFGAIN
eukprot:SAG11_NODE_10364_length_837_cov_0.693767_2_plen_47_part_01